MPILEKTSGIFGPWIDLKTNPPKGNEGYIWVTVASSSQDIPEYRILLLHVGYVVSRGKLGSSYSHWKPSHLEVPELPDKNGQSITTLSQDAALAAWRDLNPDYGPDDMPPQSFIDGFRAAQNKS